MTLHYRITVKGALDENWSVWFDGLAITHDADGNTTLEGVVRDQTALYGLIGKVRDLGLTLLVVERCAATRNTDGISLTGDVAHD